MDTNDSTFGHVRGILVVRLGVEPESVTLESRIVEDLEADPLDVTELLMRVEEEFNIQIPDSESPNLHTVGDLVNYVDSQIAATGMA